MLRTTSLCTSLLYNYITTSSIDSKEETLDNKGKKIACLADTLEKYGGVLSKISQILSLDDLNNTSFSNCKPFSKKKTIKYFKQFIKESNYKLTSVDFEVYKSGSVGQVHIAEYNNSKIIFKVQYVGLATQTITDLNILDNIALYLYDFSNLKHALSDIKKKIYEELDYKNEAYNQKIIYEIYKKSEYIQVPKIITKFSTCNVLAMYFVEGQSISEFINNSTQDNRNIFGTCIVKFIFETMYKHGILYTDIHYGNFLVKKDFTLCVLDFGCLQKINQELLKNMCKLHYSIQQDDSEKFYKIVQDIGIIKNDISQQSKIYIYEYFKLQYLPLISEEFEFTQEWLTKFSHKETELMKEWTLPSDMVYFNRIPYGLYHILTKLNFKGQFKHIFNEIFETLC